MWQHPFPKSTITDRYGDNQPPRTSPHRGTDYAPKSKSLIPAITDAKITMIKFSQCLGWFVEYKTDEHGLYIGNAHLYCNKHDSINCNGSDHAAGETCMKNLKVGDRVKMGQPVGRVGDSGECSRGSHLHITASKTPDMRFSKVFDLENFIDQKIKKQEKKAKKTSEKPSEPISEPTTPKKVQTPTPKPQPNLGAIFGRFWHLFRKHND